MGNLHKLEGCPRWEAGLKYVPNLQSWLVLFLRVSKSLTQSPPVPVCNLRKTQKMCEWEPDHPKMHVEIIHPVFCPNLIRFSFMATNNC